MMGSSLIDLLEKMLKLHKSLQQISLNKTAVIKEGNLTSLTALMQEEQKHIHAINTLEQKRIGLMTELTGKKSAGLQEALPHIEEKEHEPLLRMQEEMLAVLTALKETNTLNQLLLEQSMQFVSLNMDLLMPSADGQTYGNRGDDQSNETIKPLFDSQA